MINHHVVRLHVAMHDAVRMCKVQRLQQLVDIIADIVVAQRRIEDLEVGVLYIFEDEGRSLRN